MDTKSTTMPKKNTKPSYFRYIPPTVIGKIVVKENGERVYVQYPAPIPQIRMPYPDN